jgi:hypothetical protein
MKRTLKSNVTKTNLVKWFQLKLKNCAASEITKTKKITYGKEENNFKSYI